MDKSQTPPGRDGGEQFAPGPKVSKKTIKAVQKDPAKHLSDLFAKEYAKKKMKEEVEQIDENSDPKAEEAYKHYKKHVLPIHKKHGLSPEFAKAVNHHVAKYGSYQVWNHHGDAEGGDPHWFDSEKQKVKSIKQKRGYEVSEEVELEETTPYWKKPSFNKKMSALAKQERLAREKKEQEKKEVKEGLKPEHNMRPGWMLKADPELAAKVKKNKEINKARKASYGNPAAGRSVKEEVELDEVLNPSMGAGEYIKDFQKSDAPQFKGKSKEKRRMMGIAAYLQAKRDMKEEVESIEERNKQNALMRKTMDASRGARFKAQGNPVPDPEKQHKTAQAHNKAIGRAIRQMSNEEVEQIDELNSSDIVKIHNDAAAHHTASLANKPEQKPKSMMDKIKDKWSNADPKKYQKYYAKEEVEIDEESCSTDTGWKKVAPGNVKDKSGAVHTPMSRAKHLARMAMQKKMKEEFDIEIDDALADSLVETVLDENIWIEEALIGNQKKLDKNHNGKLDADDFKKLRKEHVDFDDEGNLVVEKVSYADFMVNLQEIKMADLPVRKVTGRAYGGGHQKDTPEHDEDEDTPKATPVPTEKRGRGRPKGSKSGANLKVTSGRKSSGVDYTGYPLHLPNRNR